MTFTMLNAKIDAALTLFTFHMKVWNAAFLVNKAEVSSGAQTMQGECQYFESEVQIF